jgi:hypothetical protein
MLERRRNWFRCSLEQNSSSPPTRIRLKGRPHRRHVLTGIPRLIIGIFIGIGKNKCRKYRPGIQRYYTQASDVKQFGYWCPLFGTKNPQDDN